MTSSIKKATPETEREKDKPYRLDLHMHSTYSDGNKTPQELVQMGKKLNLKIMSLTDHDTVAGLAECIAAGEEAGVQVLAGIEFSGRSAATATRGALLPHILGYNFDYTQPKLLQICAKQQAARRTRNRLIIEKLQQLGFAIDFEDIVNRFPHSTIGRPHIADAMIATGKVADLREAFDRYLGTQGVAFVPAQVMEDQDCIAAVREFGGKAFLAHPCTLKLDYEVLYDYIKALKSYGLEGIEVYNSSCHSKHYQEYHQIADRLDLLISGGSDYHARTDSNVTMGCCRDGKKITSAMVAHWFSPQSAV